MTVQKFHSAIVLFNSMAIERIARWPVEHRAYGWMESFA